MKILEKLLPVKEMTIQLVLYADPNASPQINFTANLDREGKTIIYFILEEAKKIVSDISQGTVKVL